MSCDSRIERLIGLLEGGGQHGVRLSAASQLGEVSRKNPSTCPTIIEKILSLFSNKSYDVRMAAAAAMDHTLAGYNKAQEAAEIEEQEAPETGKSSVTSELLEEAESAAVGLETLVPYGNAFSVLDIISSGDALLGSSGAEYSVSDVLGSGAGGGGGRGKGGTQGWKERIEAQKKLLKKQMGDDSLVGGGSTHELIKDEDLVVHAVPQQGPTSRREKLLAAHAATSGKGFDTAAQAASKRARISVPVESEVFQVHASDIFDATCFYPWFSLAQRLVRAMDASDWMIRHGACLALYTLFKHLPNRHRSIDTEQESIFLNWLTKVAMKTCYVLCTDKFADFVGDKSNCPVREVCTRLYALLYKIMCNMCLPQNLSLSTNLTLSMQSMPGTMISWLTELLVKGKSWHQQHAALFAFFSILKGQAAANKSPKSLMPLSSYDSTVWVPPLLKIAVDMVSHAQDDDVRCVLFEILDIAVDGNYFNERNFTTSGIISMEQKSRNIVALDQQGKYDSSNTLRYQDIESALWRCLCCQYSEDNELSPSLALLMALLTKLLNKRGAEDRTKELIECDSNLNANLNTNLNTVSSSSSDLYLNQSSSNLDMDALVIKLLEFIRHPMVAIRAAVSTCLTALLQRTEGQNALGTFYSPLTPAFPLFDFMRQGSSVTLLLVQSLLVEDDVQVLLALDRVLHAWIFRIQKYYVAADKIYSEKNTLHSNLNHSAKSIKMDDALQNRASKNKATIEGLAEDNLPKILDDSLRSLLRWVLLPSHQPYLASSVVRVVRGMLVTGGGRPGSGGSHTQGTSHFSGGLDLGFSVTDMPLLCTLYATESLSDGCQLLDGPPEQQSVYKDTASGNIDNLFEIDSNSLDEEAVDGRSAAIDFDALNVERAVPRLRNKWLACRAIGLLLADFQKKLPSQDLSLNQDENDRKGLKADTVHSFDWYGKFFEGIVSGAKVSYYETRLYAIWIMYHYVAAMSVVKEELFMKDKFQISEENANLNSEYPKIDILMMLTEKPVLYKDVIMLPAYRQVAEMQTWAYWDSTFFKPLGVHCSEKQVEHESHRDGKHLDETRVHPGVGQEDYMTLAQQRIHMLDAIDTQLCSETALRPLLGPFKERLAFFKVQTGIVSTLLTRLTSRIQSSLIALYLQQVFNQQSNISNVALKSEESNERLNSVALPEKLNPLIRPLTTFVKMERTYSASPCQPYFGAALYKNRNVVMQVGTERVYAAIGNCGLQSVSSHRVAFFFRDWVGGQGLAKLLLWLAAHGHPAFTKMLANLVTSILKSSNLTSQEDKDDTLLAPFHADGAICSLGWPDTALSESTEVNSESAQSASNGQGANSKIRVRSSTPKEVRALAALVQQPIVTRMTPRALLLRNDGLDALFPIFVQLGSHPLGVSYLKTNLQQVLNDLCANPANLVALKHLWLLLASISDPFIFLEDILRMPPAKDGVCRFWQAQLWVLVARSNFENVVLRVLPLLSFSGPREQAALFLEFLYNGTMMLPPSAATLHLIVPMMAWMQHWDDGVRRLASLLFAACIQQYHTGIPMNLKENGVEQGNNEECQLPMNSSLMSQQTRYRDTLARIQGLFEPSTLSDYVLPFASSFTLRPYQQAGLNWLAFLRTYGLSGILADDMGLGKTLQTLCIVAATHYEAEEKFGSTEGEKTKIGVVCKNNEGRVDNPSDYPLNHSMHQKSPEKGDRSSEQIHDQNSQSPPSLIVAPASVLGHWQDEVHQYVGSVLRPFLYVGPRAERQARLWAAVSSKKITTFNLILTSYDVIRSDVSFLTSLFPLFTYIVLDEGHAMRNPRSRLAVALKDSSFRSAHRLILSGTPIQNDILDCWTLFDWLLPGYLGTLPHFMRRFGRPILAYKQVMGGRVGQSAAATAVARRRKAACLSALDSLHKLTLPFMLRRLKEDVLQDLPPKTIIRFPCLLSPNSIQARLYADYLSHCRGDLPQEQVDQVEGPDGTDEEAQEDLESDLVDPVESRQQVTRSRPHVFQMLHNLKKICNHPALLLHPQYSSLGKGDKISCNASKEASFWKRFQVPIGELVQRLDMSAKFVALHGILRECGILKQEQHDSIENDMTENTNDAHQGIEYNDQKDLGIELDDNQDVCVVEGEEEEEGETLTQAAFSSGSGSEEARMLIFCHSKATLDVLETLFFKHHCPSVTYLRLDSTVSPLGRTAIVRRFQSDRSIQVLLLTTAAGGQGLNLTGANIVVFFENHDNPAVDLQAMDRVHRIGQRRHVSIYKLYIAESIEEKLLRLQEFKMTLVRHVITTQNVHLTSMSTKDVLAMLTAP